MRDYHFFHADGPAPKGMGRVVVWGRRLLRRLLWPVFDRQVDLFRQQDQDMAQLARRLDDLAQRLEDLDRRLDPLVRCVDDVTRRQDQLDRQVKAATAFGWDYVALTRRFAALEDHVEIVLNRLDDRPEVGQALRAVN